MTKGKVISALGSVFLCSVCFASVKAESVRNWQAVEGTRHESFALDLTNINRSASFGYFRNEESDNGRHLGFSRTNSASFGRTEESDNGSQLGFSTTNFKYIGGPRIEVVGYNTIRTTGVVTQNPEPTTMILLGTGLMAFAGYARRMKQKRSS